MRSRSALYVRSAHVSRLKHVCNAPILIWMNDRTANLLGVVGLAISDRIHETSRQILNRAGETPAAVVVIGYGFGPSNDRLRRILGLSHPGTVRLVDRLVGDSLVERRQGTDRREIALYLTRRGKRLREKLLQERLSVIRPFLDSLNEEERHTFDSLLHKILKSMDPSDMERCTLCRLCDDRVCTDCPIPAEKPPKR